MRISDWSSDVCSSDLHGLAIDQCQHLACQLNAALVQVLMHRTQRRHKTRAHRRIVVTDHRYRLGNTDTVSAQGLSSEDRRVGKEGVRTCRPGGWPSHKKKKKQKP